LAGRFLVTEQEDTMAVAAFSGDWAKLFKEEVNKSSVYKAAGKGCVRLI